MKLNEGEDIEGRMRFYGRYIGAERAYDDDGGDW